MIDVKRMKWTRRSSSFCPRADYRAARAELRSRRRPSRAPPSPVRTRGLNDDYDVAWLLYSSSLVRTMCTYPFTIPPYAIVQYSSHISTFCWLTTHLSNDDASPRPTALAPSHHRTAARDSRGSTHAQGESADRLELSFATSVSDEAAARSSSRRLQIPHSSRTRPRRQPLLGSRLRACRMARARV